MYTFYHAQSAFVPLGHGTSATKVGRAAVMILRPPAMTGQMIMLDRGPHRQWRAVQDAAGPEG